MRSVDEVQEGEAFESETSFYRELTTGTSESFGGRVHRLTTLLSELIIEDEDLESMFESKERYFRHYPRFGERAWLRLGEDFVVLWDEGSGIRFLQIVLKSRTSTNGLRMCRRSQHLRKLGEALE
jgi:hypothetical protein